MKSENAQSADHNIADFLLACIGVSLISKTVKVKQEALRFLLALLEIAIKKDDGRYETLEAAIEMPMNHRMMLVVERDASLGVSKQQQLRSHKSQIRRIHAS